MNRTWRRSSSRSSGTRFATGAVSFLFARDGVEALAVLKANRDVDMVVTDINMPRMDGLSLLEKLQESEEKLSTIIVSAYGDMANIRTAMNRGAFDFLTKPIDFLDLETTIAKTIRHIEVLRDARQRQAEAERAHASLSRYFSPNLAERLASDVDAIDLGGQRREIATLFTDIAGFTALVETLEPDVLGPLLNDYLTGMTDIVFAHDGTVAKIVGDALHVLFGAPGEQPDHAARAVGCALALDEYAQSFRETLAQKGCRAGSHADRCSCRAGDRRQFRWRPLLRLHSLRRHHQRCGATGSCQQATRHPHMCQCDAGDEGGRFSRPTGRRPYCCGVGRKLCALSSPLDASNMKIPQRRVISRRLPSWKPAIPVRWQPLQRMLGNTPMINSPAFTSSGC